MYPNIFRTLYFNIRAFGLRKGLKLPVYVYSKVKVYNMGRIDIKCPLKRNIISIGLNECDVPLTHTIWNNTGRIEVHGRVFINFGSKVANSGTIVFGGGNAVGSACSITIADRLELGRNTSFGRWTDVMDSDAHFTIDVDKRIVQRNSRPIRIGSFNWFGSHTHVKKGTTTPDYILVASPGALLCKDYSTLTPYTILAGSPARPIAQGKRRIYNFQNEASIRQFFADKAHEAYVIPKDINLDDFCQYKQ